MLSGGRGSDHLYGGSGNDVLIGGKGKDKLWGEAGRDTFQLRKGPGHDTVMDFTDGIDRLELPTGLRNISIGKRANDALISQGNDLLAIIKGAAGDLEMSGNFIL